MKNLILLLTIISMVVSAKISHAQVTDGSVVENTFVDSTDTESAKNEFDFAWGYLGQGESPVASGQMFGLGVSHGDNTIKATFGPTNGYVIYSFSDFAGIKELSFGPSAGFFSGVPWVGPIATYSPVSFVEITGWVGLSAGDAVDGKLSTEPEAAFTQADFKFLVTDYTHVGFTYLEFGGDSYLPYVGGSLPLGDKMQLFGSATYDITAEELMFFLGFRFEKLW